MSVVSVDPNLASASSLKLHLSYHGIEKTRVERCTSDIFSKLLFCDFAHIIDLDVHLLQIQIYASQQS
jgi:hypothetical protein